MQIQFLTIHHRYITFPTELTHHSENFPSSKSLKNYTFRITRSEILLDLNLRFNGQRISREIYRRDRSATPLSVSWNSTHGRSRGAETMVPPLIPRCFDHVWNLKRLSIIILPSRGEKREPPPSSSVAA